MSPAQIEGMIDRICGLFPTTQIGRNTVKNAWTKDDFLLDATVEEARLVTDWIKDNCEKFPASLKETKKIFNLVRSKGSKTTTLDSKDCDICFGTLWDNGERFEDGKQIRKAFTTVHKDHRYSVVKPCSNCRGEDWVPPSSNY
jgi:hypothetical protein